MTDKIDPKQQHLDDRAPAPKFKLVEEPEGQGAGMSPKEASTFLGRLRPILRLGKTLKEAAKEAKKKA